MVNYTPLTITFSVLPVVVTACKPCGQKYFGGGEATLTLSVLEPEEVETTWTIPGMTKDQLSRDPGGDAAELLADGFEGAAIGWPRNLGGRGGWVYFEAWVPTEDNPGIVCIEEPIVGFQLLAEWPDDGTSVGSLQVNLHSSAPEWEGSSPGIGSVENEDLKIQTDNKIEGSLDASEMRWQRIDSEGTWADCTIRSTLTVSWHLDRGTSDVHREGCDHSIMEG